MGGLGASRNEGGEEAKQKGNAKENDRKMGENDLLSLLFSLSPLRRIQPSCQKGVLMLRMLPGGPGGSRGTATDRRKRRCWQMKRSKERPETHKSHKPDHKAAEKPLCTSQLQRLAPPKYQPYPYLGDALKKYLIAACKMVNRCFLYKQAAVEGAFAPRWDVDCGSATLI